MFTCIFWNGWGFPRARSSHHENAFTAPVALLFTNCWKFMFYGSLLVIGRNFVKSSVKLMDIKGEGEPYYPTRAKFTAGYLVGCPVSGKISNQIILFEQISGQFKIRPILILSTLAHLERLSEVETSQKYQNSRYYISNK